MQIVESFFEGINRAVSREQFFNPNEFYTLQNARILQTGKIGEIVRIKGYESISNELDDLSLLYDIVKVDDTFIAFYKTTATVVSGEFEYKIKIFNSTGTLVKGFTYRDSVEPKNRGQLKQHEDSIFVSPHNKILYNVNDTYILSEFISKPAKINDIQLETETANLSQYNITVNETLAGFAGQQATGSIRVNRNNFPEGVEATLKVSIGGTESIETIPFDSSTSRLRIRQELIRVINETVAFNGVWEANRSNIDAHMVDIKAVNVGTSANGTEINIVGAGSTYVRVDEDRNRDGLRRITDIENIQETSNQDFNYITTLSQTFGIKNMSGGVASDTISGTVSVTIKDAIVTEKVTILNTDTVGDIAQKLFNIISKDEFIKEKYSIALIQNPGAPTTMDTINLIAREVGKKYNTNIFININEDGVEINLPDNFFSVTQITEGTDENVFGTLQPYTHYWYKARLVYEDGHITSTCSPRLIESGPNGIIDVFFDFTDIKDLDGDLPRIQVFRKKEGDGFFLIEETKVLETELDINAVYQYVDKGKSNIEPLTEVTTRWTKSHEAQEVSDNRLIKANIKILDENYTVADNGFTVDISPITDDLERDVAPYNSKAQVYIRPQYKDGTKGFFTEIGDAFIATDPAEINLKQNFVIEDTEKIINNLEVYGRYLPYGEEKNVEFNSVEIQTEEIQSIADPQEFSLQTQIFFGYKYIIVSENTTDGTKEGFIPVDGWNIDYDLPFRFIGNVGNRSLRIDETDRLIANVHGARKSYIPVAQANFPNQERDRFTVYKLEMFDALEDAVSTGNLSVRLIRSSRGVLSSTVDDNDLQDIRVGVTGIDDKTFGSNTFEVKEDGVLKYLAPPADSRIYLTLESSKLDQVNNKQLNEWDFKARPPSRTGTVTLPLRKTGKLAFTLINFEERQPAEFSITDTNKRQTIKGEDGDHIEYDVTPSKYLLINRDLTIEDQVIYLGMKENEVNLSPVTFETTGFRFNLRSNLFYSRLANYNIYSKLLKQTDFNFNIFEFTNQIIWSNPLIKNNYFSGGRNYEPTNFYNIPSENGEILDIISLGGNIFVFCERGVAKLLVGETLTQQKNGQVFVNSAGFITKHVWMLENTPNIKPDSLVKRDNAIYWCDGNDVYQLTQEGFGNISQGILNLDSTVDYKASFVNKYDEYRLSGNGETFVYNTKYQKWYGPHTYTPFKTIEIDDKIISFDGKLIREDIGNTFAGVAYTTLIQSVGNDTEQASIDKTYRKFYFDVEGELNSTFKYGKDFNSMVSKSLSNIIKKNGYYNLGIANTEGNTRKIYWDIETTNSDFSLKGFETAFTFRRRR